MSSSIASFHNWRALARNATAIPRLHRCLGDLLQGPRPSQPVPRHSSKLAGNNALAQPTESSSFFGAGFEIYKGKAAMQCKPLSPTVGRMGNGKDFQLQRKGVLLLDVAPATGPKSYDWTSKITMALSVLEMSQLFLSDFDKVTQMQFVHDPGMQTATRGQVMKTLAVYPGTDGNTLMLSFAERSPGVDRKVTLPLSAAEFRVVSEMCRYLIPHFLGLDHYVDVSSSGC